MQFLFQLIWDRIQDSAFLTVFWADSAVTDLGSTSEELRRESQKLLDFIRLSNLSHLKMTYYINKRTFSTTTIKIHLFIYCVSIIFN